ncbi:CHAT domain-containing protein [Saccharothrix syringae]|uniref:CHAT domain-containing protein n=1 Tax=Saccharothrix syringae TaxID=103733 RepID=A0A5Q0GWZ5_SACSY|nr:CHAT domain-containing protein [Saccharothrix syringae]QFZ18499.1 CHAT domain-containing protein [Saccharothrix syringae]
MHEYQWLVARSITRTTSFYGDDDVGALLTPEAAVEVARLEQLASSPSPYDPVVVLRMRQVLAMEYWARFLGDPQKSWKANLGPALRHFHHVHAVMPGNAPRAVLPIVSAPLPALEEAVTREPPLFLNMVGLAAQSWHAETGSGIALDRAIDLFREVFGKTPHPHVDREGFGANLAVALLKRHGDRQVRRDLDEGIDILSAVSAEPGRDADLRRGVLLNLGSALRERYRLTGDVGDIRAAAAAVDRADGDPADWGRARAEYLDIAFAVLDDLLAVDRDLALADRLVDLGRRIVAVGAATDPEFPLRLTRLAAVLRDRHEYRGDPADLTASVALSGRALALCREPGSKPVPHERMWAMCMAHLKALVTRAQTNSDARDVDTALTVLHEVASALPPSFEREFQVERAQLLRVRFPLSGDRADLARAVHDCESAVAAEEDHDKRDAYARALSRVLDTRFTAFGARADVDRSIRILRDLLARVGDRPPDLLLLARRLGIRYEAFGDPADLEESIRYCRAAARAWSDQGKRPDSDLNVLAVCLLLRFQRFGRLSDLDECTALGERLLADMPDHDPDRAEVVQNLGSAHWERYKRSRHEADLRATLAHCRAVLAATTPADSARSAREARLAAVLMDSFHHGHARPEDLHEAIGLLRHVVARTAPNHPHLPMYLNDLGTALRLRYTAMSDETDLDEAIDAHRRAVDAVSPDHFDYSLYALSLASALGARRSAPGADPEGLAELWKLVETAVDLPAAPTDMRIKGAEFLASAAWYEGDLARAVAAYRKAMRLLPRLVWRGLDRDSQEDHLHRWSGLASTAAVCAIEADDPVAAVEILEQGRGILWNQQLAIRGELDELDQADPGTAARLREIRRLLDDDPATRQGTGAVALPGQASDVRMRLAREWDELVDRIRHIPGFEHVDAPLAFNRLRAAAGGGVVVMINVHPTRCDAIAFTADSERPQVIPLERLTAQEVHERANAFLVAFTAADDDVGPRLDALRSVLDWLWRTVVEEVLDALGFRDEVPDDADGPRLWWCPTGALAVLPLHAAGVYQDGAAGPTALDRVVSSYASTLGALLRSRRPGKPVPVADLLTVSVAAPAGAAGGRRLVHAEAERQRLVEVCGPHDQLVDGEATAARVVRAIGDCGWLHLACHATVDVVEPVNSAVQLHDGPLTVLDIARNEHTRGGEVAFLSACDTAMTGRNVNEVVHLAAAFQAIGYRHVVATQWHVLDPYTPIIARDVYRQVEDLRRLDPTRLASAVRSTVQGLRRVRGEDLLAWAAYIHLGP